MRQEESKESFCFYAGLCGAVISLGAVIQMLIVAGDHWLAYLVILFELFSVTAYSVLASKSRYSFIFLLVNLLLLVLVNFIFLITYSFSLLVVLLLIYSIIIFTIFLANGISSYLKKLYWFKTEDNAFWQNKLS